MMPFQASISIQAFQTPVLLISNYLDKVVFQVINNKSNKEVINNIVLEDVLGKWSLYDYI